LKTNGNSRTVLPPLFFISPKNTAAAQSSLVPYALAVYFLINLAGLSFALRRGLPDWAVYLSIALDVALLMLLIWSFHRQYMQPASFYLKAPTLLYVFIFIALRALRFEARFVVAAGCLAALGWTALVAYAVFSDPSNTMITRDYIQYMTSNAVLIGAEFDKIISILLVSGIIALALKRARGFLVDATAEGITAQDLFGTRRWRRGAPRGSGPIHRHPGVHAACRKTQAAGGGGPADRLSRMDRSGDPAAWRQYRQVFGRWHHGVLRGD
jgi:hypothetical protein